MAKINLLDSAIYNLLSAGEVVENPASIVKELVENSIDAGANEISITISDGGIKSITVTDNGIGIEPDELEKAVLPHATSKIKEANDLQSIATLGFRGEALPSIAAVSEVEIKSKYIDADFAKMITVKGGGLQAGQTIPLSKGTSVKVSNLFYNTPARLKFLKTPGAEQSAVTYVLKNLALSHPFIAFKYTQEDKEVFSTLGNGLENAILAVYGKEIADNLIKVDTQDRGISVQGYISNPSLYKSNRRHQTLIINSRVLNAPEVQATIQNAYAHRLMTRCFPVYILDIVMPFDSLDVNVHPQKATVRFANARTVCSVVYYAVRNALEQYERVSFSPFASTQVADTQIAENKEADKAQVSNKDIEEAESKKIIDNAQGLQTKLSQAYKYTPEKHEYTPTDKGHAGMVSAVNLSPLHTYKGKASIAPMPTQDEIASLPKESAYKIIGQVFDTYIILEMNRELIFIDQHAAHERILFDQMLADFAANPSSQLLLTPYIYSCAYDDISYLIDFLPKLKQFGFDIEEFGDNHFKVGAIPNALKDLEIQSFLDSVLNDKYTQKNEALEEYIAKKCCKSAIKGGDSLSNKEIAYIMDYFITHSLPMHCPHGRPTIIKFKKKELDALFGRIK